MARNDDEVHTSRRTRACYQLVFSPEAGISFPLAGVMFPLFLFWKLTMRTLQTRYNKDKTQRISIYERFDYLGFEAPSQLIATHGFRVCVNDDPVLAKVLGCSSEQLSWEKEVRLVREAVRCGEFVFYMYKGTKSFVNPFTIVAEAINEENDPYWADKANVGIIVVNYIAWFSACPDTAFTKANVLKFLREKIGYPALVGMASRATYVAEVADAQGRVIDTFEADAKDDSDMLEAAVAKYPDIRYREHDLFTMSISRLLDSQIDDFEFPAWMCKRPSSAYQVENLPISSLY